MESSNERTDRKKHKKIMAKNLSHSKKTTDFNEPQTQDT